MTVDLVRGANTVLPRDPGALALAFRWRVLPGRGPLTEPVAAAVVCGRDGRALSPEHVVFFNELAAPDGAMRYAPEGEQERIEVDLAAVPADVGRVVLVVYVNPDPRRPGSLAALRGLGMDALDPRGGTVARFAIDQVDDPAIAALIVAELYRHEGWWKLRAVGQGFQGGFPDVARAYGLDAGARA